MKIARAYNAGRCTQAAVAAELGVSVRRAQRIEEQAIAVLALAVCRNLRPLVGMAPLSLRQIPRRFRDRISDGLAEDDFDTAPDVRRAPRLDPWRRARCPFPEEPMTRNTTKIPITATAAALVQELEATPAGEPIDDVMAEATAAIAADRAAALAVIFPQTVVRAGADTIALLTYHTSRLDRPGYGDKLAALHGRALQSAEELCGLLRSPEATADVETAAASLAAPSNAQESYTAAGERAAAEARCKYQRAIAAQLADHGGELAAEARAFLGAELLADRVTAAAARHEAHARQVADQIERDRAAAAAAADQALDIAAGEAELASVLRDHRLPATLRSGEFYESKRALCILRATAKRRLSSTRIDALRLSIGQGVGLYGTRDLARTLGEFSLGDLQSLLGVLDRAEGRNQIP